MTRSPVLALPRHSRIRTAAATCLAVALSLGGLTAHAGATSEGAALPACTIAYAGPAGGSWAEPVNWSPPHVPNVTDIVCAGSTKSSIPKGTAVHIMGLSMPNGSLLLDGTLRVESELDVPLASVTGNGTFTTGPAVSGEFPHDLECDLVNFGTLHVAHFANMGRAIYRVGVQTKYVNEGSIIVSDEVNSRVHLTNNGVLQLTDVEDLAPGVRTTFWEEYLASNEPVEIINNPGGLVSIGKNWDVEVPIENSGTLVVNGLVNATRVWGNQPSGTGSLGIKYASPGTEAWTVTPDLALDIRHLGGTLPFTVPAGATASVGDSTAPIVNEGTLSVSGALTSLHSSGTVVVPATARPKVTTLVLQPSSVVQIQATAPPLGVTYGVLSAKSAVLDGVLETTLLDGYIPAALSAMTPVVTSSRTGRFDTVTPATFGAGLVWRPAYPTTGLTLTAVDPTATPGPPTTVTATAGASSAIVTWVAPTVSGTSPITTYVITADPGGQTQTAAFPATNSTMTGLAPGVATTFTVRADNASGPGPDSTPSPPVLPTGVATPTAPTRVDGCGTTQDRYTIPATTSTDYLVAGTVKAPGSHPGTGTVVISAQPRPGWTLTGNTQWTFNFNPGVCPVTLTVPPVNTPTVAGANVTFTWSGTKVGVNAGTLRYDIIYRTVTADPTTGVRTYSAETTWKTAATGTSGTFPSRAGTVLQFRARTRDAQDALGPWSSWKSTVIAENETRTGSAWSTGWSATTGSSYYLGTIRRTSTAGAAYSTNKVWCSSITLIGAKLPSGSRASIYIDGVLKTTIDTAAATTSQRQTLYTIQLPYGPHHIGVANLATAGRPNLWIDGIAFAR